MLLPDEIKYIEKEIKKTISSISHEHFQYIMNSSFSGYEEEHQGWTNYRLRTRLRDLYYLILTYLEAKGMPLLLQTYREKFSKVIEDDGLILESEMAHPEGDHELKLIIGFKQFLDPFKYFDYNQSKEDETKKLISILKNSGFIIKNTKSKVANEADIYNEVKWVIGLYYPTCRRKNKSSFIQEFKTYNPDILIPELKTAIEFKYIKNKTDNFDNFIDQIKVDSANYTDDYRYEKFIAVFYISDIGLATPESIEVAWKAKKIPNNWELVITGDNITK
ncbi:hypothetical protein ACD591_01125 [Rufibacter glacialis]|uniref:Uncharacterized protein n=1 Tax=Rufibacter glacialis TaxID=1259555 RepID=A0A5M8QMQ6_9BACT|nr:hypothetical protein [Rufibacter glacialis]KAA6435502.1 hypothetical protein FOE74_06030 [Rufibacter glacialis]GGK64073.1 hypothetical protein GCM10011405_10060 [Rufibacter glacialis]